MIAVLVLISPLPRFDAPLSTVVEASDGTLLGARIAADGQWRFPEPDTIPGKYVKALLAFEDKYFYMHPGVNPVSLFRAWMNNLDAGRIVSGGSTITMQVARMARGNRPRTYRQKFVEILSAIKLELFRTKKTILKMYAGNAPFGGNIVGLEAATWRYLGKSPAHLTWSEAAAMAVLPNSPSLVYPGRNQETLKARRDNLLKKMFETGYFDSITLALAVDEPLPGAPKPLPSTAPHLTDYFNMFSPGKRITTMINPELQERAAEIINSHQKNLSGNFINNLACVIVEVPTGDVIAYIGNSVSENHAGHSGDVDIARAYRSTGSILKPLLYAGMQKSGDILPNTLIADIPTRFPGFSPKNFDLSFSGAVTASNALSQSLNIPAVKMLQKYGTERFLYLLERTGFTSFDKTADHYGLSLILGGGETSLLELVGVYASLSRVLGRYNTEGKYYADDYHPPVVISYEKSSQGMTEDPDPPLSASSIWLTYEALKKVSRPESEAGWHYFSSSPDIAWKTGTSFGFRDAWAVGTTPDYVIGVWAGNADGEGRPGLTGITAAAPVLFDLAGMMGTGDWFVQPMEEMTRIRVCRESGFRAGPDCPYTEDIYADISGLRSEACPWHRIIHLDKSRSRQVNADCEKAEDIRHEPWFVLPPAMEYFYRQKHPAYRVLPPWAQGCMPDREIAVMEFIYPSSGIKIFIPRDQRGLQTKIIPEVVHRIPSKKIFWHLDGEYVKTTRMIHHIEILAGPGPHTLTVVDEDGNTLKSMFTISGTTK